MRWSEYVPVGPFSIAKDEEVCEVFAHKTTRIVTLRFAK